MPVRTAVVPVKEIFRLRHAVLRTGLPADAACRPQAAAGPSLAVGARP